MKTTKATIFALCASLLLMTGCGMSNTGKGALIGSTTGGAAGAGIGALIGKLAGGSAKSTKVGAAIGAAVGVAAGTTVGTLIGHKMDKAAKAAEALKGTSASVLTDIDGTICGVRVTFEGGLLFASGTSTLTNDAKSTLTSFCKDVLTPDMDLAVVGHTDNDAWKGCTATQSTEKNQKLSEDRANAVSKYLRSAGATSTQILKTIGQGETNPVASNETAEGKAQNRRVEVYIVPSEEMVKAAEKEAAANK